jgi:single-stranded-DNA-specific exonuclease
VPGFDLAAALRGCSDLLEKHGGHAMAAGVTLKPDNVNAFRLRLNAAARLALPPELLVPELRLDAVVPLRELTVERLGELARLEPFGQQNPPLQFVIPRVTLAQPPQKLGREQQHWKFRLTDGAATADALCWGAVNETPPSGTFDVAAVPQVNEFNGRRSVRLKFLDWRPAA